MGEIVPKNALVLAGVIVVLAVTLVGILAPQLAPHDPTVIDILNAKIAPGQTITYPLGTDFVGRDISSRIIFSLRLYAIMGALSLLLGTAVSLLVVLIFMPPQSNPGQRKSHPVTFLDYSLLRLSAVSFVMSYSVGLVALNQVIILRGNGIPQVVVHAVIFSAIVPVALIYQSTRRRLASAAGPEQLLSSGEKSASSPVRLALRQSLILAPVNYSLTFLMAMFVETLVSFLRLGFPPGASDLGIMMYEGRFVTLTVWWLSLTPLAVVSISAGAFLAIILPIRRMQKQAEAAVQQEPVAMIYSGLWPRIPSIVIDALILLLVGAIVGALINVVVPSDFVSIVLVPIEIVYLTLFVGGYLNSVGHRLFKLKVVRADGTPVGIGLSFIRGLMILGLFIIGILVIPFSGRRRALYDLLTDTFVVKQ